MSDSMRWQLDMTAQSSICHGGQIRGTLTLMRREAIVTPAGERVEVPIISGNSLRGILRRTGEEMMRDGLDLAGVMPISAAAALRGGGALLRSSSQPLSGSRLARVRSLVPQISIFGSALGSVIVDGALSVGKVIPLCEATNHITGASSTTPVMVLTQLEGYSRVDDSQFHSAPAHVEPRGKEEAPGPMRFEIETLPAGTQLTSWVRLDRPTDLEASFFTELIERWCADAHLGGRRAVGHGQVRVTAAASHTPRDLPSWRELLEPRRAEIIDVLADLA